MLAGGILAAAGMRRVGHRTEKVRLRCPLGCSAHPSCASFFRSRKRVLVASAARALGLHLLERNAFELLGGSEKDTVSGSPSGLSSRRVCLTFVWCFVCRRTTCGRCLRRPRSARRVCCICDEWALSKVRVAVLPCKPFCACGFAQCACVCAVAELSSSQQRDKDVTLSAAFRDIVQQMATRRQGLTLHECSVGSVSALAERSSAFSSQRHRSPSCLSEARRPPISLQVRLASAASLCQS